MTIEEFLNNPEEEEVYVVPDNEELVELYRQQSDLPIIAIMKKPMILSPE